MLMLRVAAAGILCLGAGAALAQDRGFDPRVSQERINTGARLALVIGNSAYKDAPLTNPVNDARAMAATLRQLGFEVMEGTNLDQKQMKQKAREFGERLRSTQGVGLFFFAGHGMQVRGDNYLVPVGAEVGSESEVEYEAVSMGFFIAQMEAASNPLNLVIIDACRNNPFARSFRSGDKGLAQVSAPTGTLIAYATAPGSVASDGGAGPNGLYTQELLRHLKVPGIPAEELFKRVRIGVRQATAGRQTPWEASSLVGDFYFVRPATQQAVASRAEERPVAPQPAPVARVDSVRRKWLLAFAEGSSADSLARPALFSASLTAGDEMIRLDPTLADSAYFHRQIVAASYAAPTRMLDIASRAVEAYPNVAMFWQLKGSAERKTSQPAAALASLRRAMALDPKTLGGHLLMAQSFLDLDQPDSAFALARVGIAAGDDPKSWGVLLLAPASAAFKAAQTSQKVDDYQRALRRAQEADKVASTPSAKLLIGVTAFQIAIGSLQSASLQSTPAPARCPAAKNAQDMFALAQATMPLARSVDASVAQQVMATSRQYAPYADQTVKVYCK